jgi:rod shape-determining protein MreC
LPVLTDYLSRRGEYLVLILVIVLSVTLMLLSAAEKGSVARAVSDTALTPVQVVLTKSTRLVDLRAENDELRARLAQTSLDLTRMREVEAESHRLRTMLDFRDNSAYIVVAARVIAREAETGGTDYKIDKGVRDGLRKDLAVMTLDGLVGKITAVEPGSAFVRPLVAPNCQVSVRLQRTRAQGILSWSNGEGTYLSFLPLRTEIDPDEAVVTSGLGGVYPRGILVGHATRSEALPADGSLRVHVAPAVEFSSVEEVFVVLALDERALELQKAAADSAAATVGN